MSSLDFQLGLLFGHLGRSSSKFKAEGLSINIPRLGVELGMTPEELTAILLHAETEGMLEITITQAVVKLIPQGDDLGIELEVAADVVTAEEMKSADNHGLVKS